MCYKEKIKKDNRKKKGKLCSVGSCITVCRIEKHLISVAANVHIPGNLEATVSLILGAQQALSASMSLSSRGCGAFCGAIREGPWYWVVSSPSVVVLVLTPGGGSGLGGSSRISVMGSVVERSFQPFSNLERYRKKIRDMHHNPRTQIKCFRKYKGDEVYCIIKRKLEQNIHKQA